MADNIFWQITPIIWFYFLITDSFVNLFVQLADGPYSSYYNLLNLFAYGTFSDYKGILALWKVL